MSKDFVVTVTNPERAAEWQSVLGTVSLCVESPIAEYAHLLGFDEPQRVYLLDLKVLSDEQRERMIAHLSKKFSIPIEVVHRGLLRHLYTYLTRCIMHNLSNRLENLIYY